MRSGCDRGTARSLARSLDRHAEYGARGHGSSVGGRRQCRFKASHHRPIYSQLIHAFVVNATITTMKNKTKLLLLLWGIYSAYYNNNNIVIIYSIMQIQKWKIITPFIMLLF